MADDILYWGGKQIRLKDNGDGTFSLAQSGSVSLTGRYAPLGSTALTTTPLAAGAAFVQTAQAVDVAGGLIMSELWVVSDTNFTVGLEMSPDGATWNTVISVSLPGSATTPRQLPPMPVSKKYYRWRVTNPTAAGQTVLSVSESRLQFWQASDLPMRASLVEGLQIRDTIQHLYSNVGDAPMMFLTTWSRTSSHKILQVRNTLDQQVTFVFRLGHRGFWGGVDSDLKTGLIVPALTTKTFTDADIPGLNGIIDRFYLAVQCSVAPTTGALYAVIMM